MKKYLAAFLTIFFFFQNSDFFAQQILEHVVHFDSGKDKPMRKEQEKLDSLLHLIKNKELPYLISVYGHTDNVGSEQLNKSLSTNRAKNLAAYLKHEFKTAKIDMAGKYYTEPVSSDTTLIALASNRRVYISIVLPVPQIANIGDIKLDKREYIIDADKNDTLVYTSGTKLYIKSGIFVDAQGNKVNGKVTISYVEFRDPIDFILSGAHMNYSNNGENMIFNSSGMFDISGKQGDKPVFIKKGEEIKIDFVPTKSIEPGTDFYSYNTTQQKWSDLSIVPPTATPSQTFQGHGDKVGEFEICAKSMCDAAQMAVDKGYELAKNKTAVFTRLVKAYELNLPHLRLLDDSVKKYDTQLKIAKKKLDSLWREVNDKPAYAFKSVNTPSGSAFKIECDTSLKNNFLDLEHITWFCNSFESKRTASRFIGSEVFAVRLIKLDNKGNSVLRITKNKGDKKSTLLNVKMKFQEGDAIVLRKELYKTYRQRVKAVKDYTKSIEQEHDHAVAKYGGLERGRKLFQDSIEVILAPVNRDSAKCFWANNKTLMKPNEKAMNMLFWYEHFEKNITTYEQLYSQMKATNAVVDTCKAIEKRKELDALKAQYEQTATSQIMVSLSVGSFGVFNCDQIERLKFPKEIIASYKDIEGKDLLIKTIYLIDDKINSVLVYNGYRDYSPSKFVYSPASNNRLIGFDDKGAPWLCSFENFKEGAKSAEKMKTFVLKKVTTVKSKEELAAMN